MSELTVGIEATDAGAPGGERHGVFRYLQQLLLAFRETGEPACLRLWFNSFLSVRRNGIQSFLSEVGGSHTEVVVSRFPARLRRGLNLPADWFTGEIDVFHAPSHLLPNVRGVPAVVTIHDVAFFRMLEADMKVRPEWAEIIRRRSPTAAKDLKAYQDRCGFFARLRREAPKTLARADAIIAVSEATARDLMEIARVPAARIRVVPNGPTPGLAPVADREAVKRTLAGFGIEGDYVLYVGVLDPNKDLHTLLAAFADTTASFQAEHRLVIAGPRNWFRPILEDEAERLGIAPRVHFTGYVPDGALASLYSGATVVVCPSSLEGFGFPVLEAMTCDAPVIVAGAGALPEIAGAAALQFPPHDSSALSRLLEKVAGSPSVTAALKDKGRERCRIFSWARTAQMTSAIYRELAALKRGRAGAPAIQPKAAAGASWSAEDLMARAVEIFSPDVGLAVHRAFEAREVIRRMPEGAVVLDLGAGDGRFTRLWRSHAAPPRIAARLDLQSSLLGAEGASGEMPAIAGDGRTLPFKEQTFDVVVANSVLTHVANLERPIEEIARVLKPAGRLLASVPGPEFEEDLAEVRLLKKAGLLWLARRAGDRYHVHWGQWHRDGAPFWSRRLGAFGLSLVEAEPYPGRRGALVWSLFFGLLRLGRGRATLLGLLLKLGAGRRGPRTKSRLSSMLSYFLAPFLSEPGSRSGSLFLVAGKKGAFRSPAFLKASAKWHPGEKVLLPNRGEGLRWLRDSKIRVRGEASILEGGYANFIDDRTGESPMLYCEITAYASQFWLRQAGQDSRSLALAAGECLLRSQQGQAGGELQGAFPFGLSRPEGEAIPAYFSFDAGIAAAALVDLAGATGEARFAGAAVRAGEFLLRMQSGDGSFIAVRRPNPDHPKLPRMEPWFADRCALHGKNAIGLLKLWRLTGEERWRAAATRVLDWLRTLQGSRGEFPQGVAALQSMSHTHCYAAEGLLFAGLVLEDHGYLTAGLRAAEWLRLAQARCGALYRNYESAGSDFPRPAAPRDGIHVGPVAQAIRIWWVADRVTPSRRWVEASRRGLSFLAGAQVSSSDPDLAGAFPSSARRLGPWLHYHRIFSPWEVMFACEAVRLWSGASDDPESAIF